MWRGAFPGRNPGTWRRRASRLNTLSTHFWMSAGGIVIVNLTRHGSSCSCCTWAAIGEFPLHTRTPRRHSPRGTGEASKEAGSDRMGRLGRAVRPEPGSESGERDSNSRPPPWQGGVLPLNYPRVKPILLPTRLGEEGLEPSRIPPLDPKSSASASSATHPWLRPAGRWVVQDSNLWPAD